MMPTRHQLRELRQSLGIRQYQVAAEMGKTAAWVCLIEQGSPDVTLTLTYARRYIEAVERIHARRQAALAATREQLDDRPDLSPRVEEKAPTG